MHKTTDPHILLVRLSALGDVLMLLPVVRSLREQYPEVNITVLSQPFARPLFEAIDGVHFVAADIRGQYHGIIGLLRLARKLAHSVSFTHIADVHQVLRSRILLFFFRCLRCPFSYKIRTIRKGRTEKKALTRPKQKELQPLKHSVERYADVLQRLGYRIQVPRIVGGLPPLALPQSIEPLFATQHLRVGIAPFAKHRGKIYDLDRMHEVVKQLNRKGVQIFLLGARGEEQEFLERWLTKPNIVVLPAYHFNLLEELSVVQHLDLMLSMDSANMHLASWAGTPTLSIWGATHPYAGFYGWGQDDGLALQCEDLTCRPCSIYGNKPCFRGDYACLDIPAEYIVRRIWDILATKM